MNKRIFRELFQPDRDSVLTRWPYFIANIWLALFAGLAAVTMPVYPGLLGFPYSSSYFLAYNTAVLYTVIDTLLVWRTDYLIVDLMSFAVTILIILVPSGYLTKKELSA